MNYPKINLAIDNCFASKRWTEPEEWLSLIRDIGLQFAEASADNECDPLYSTPAYLEKWMNEIQEFSSKTGVKVCNLYSGHGTYSTLGLAHTDTSVKDHILNSWLKRMVKNAQRLDAGLGFFCHAFNQSTLQDKDRYQLAYEDLIDRLAELSSFAATIGLNSIGVEQMYTPHQIPWTVKGGKELIKKVYERSKHPFYITIDTGHQSGQRKFLKPDMEMIRESLMKDKKNPSLWLCTERSYRLFEEAVGTSSQLMEDRLHAILDEMRNYPHLFSEYQDGDPYHWLEELGGYSPIIHLQQTDGFRSAHWPFTEEYNSKGIITAEKVLESIAVAYQKPEDESMPPRCEEIFLTIEVFSGTSDIPYQIRKNLEETIQYWRKAVPEDGKRLDDLMEI